MTRVISRGVVGSLLVAIGGLVTQVVPWSSGPATHPLLAAIRASGEGRLLAWGVTVLGLGLLGSAWWQLLRRPERVHVATAAWALPLLLAPPLFSRDGWSYAAQGVLTHIGLSPYVWTPSILDGPVREGVDPLWLWAPAPYGPIPLGWGGLVAGISDDPWLLVLGYRVLALLGLVLLAWAVPRLARAAGTDPSRASVVVLASPLTLVHGVGGLHNDLVMAALMAAALAVALDHPWVLGAGLAGAAAAVKVPGGAVAIAVALVSLPLLATTATRLRRLASVAAVSVTVLASAGLLVGVGNGWVHALGTPAEVDTPLSLTTLTGRLVGGAELWQAVGLVAALGYAGWVALRGRTGDPASAVRYTALVVTGLVVLSPAVHTWYLLWALPFLAAARWSPPVTDLVRDAALVLGVAAPLDVWWHGVPVEAVVALALVGVAVLRSRRRSADTTRVGPRDRRAQAAGVTDR